MQTIISANENILRLIKEITISEEEMISSEKIKIRAILKNMQKAECDEKQPEI